MATKTAIRVEILGDGSSAQKAFKDTGDSAKAFEGKLGGMKDAFDHASVGAKALGAAMAGAGIGIALKVIDGAAELFGKLKGSVIDTNATLEQSAQSWSVLLGSTDKAQDKIQELYKFAADTPFEFGEVDKASRLLQTFGGDLLNTKENLTLVGDVAAGTGQPFSDVAMWTGRMYSAMQSGQPFGEAAQRLQEMGALSGDARLELEKLQKSGASGDVLWAKFTETMGRYNGMMDKQAGTFNGLMSTVQDTINQLMATAGKPIFEMATAGLKRFTEAVSSPQVAAFAQTVATKLAGALELVGRLIERAYPPVERFVRGLLSGGQAVLDATRAFASGQTNLGQFIGGMEILVGKTFGNLGNIKDKIGGILGPILGKVVEFIQSVAPQIGAQLGIWGQRFGGWVQETALPFLGEKLGNLKDWLIAWIQNPLIPDTIAGMKLMGAAFAAWVTDTAVPFLRKNLPIWWDALSTWITGTAVPAIVEAAKSFARAFGNWVNDDAVPYLRTQLPLWWAALSAWVTGTAVPALQEKAKEFARAFGNWVADDAVPYLQTQLPIWLDALGKWITQTAAPALLDGAKHLGAAMVAGIIAGLYEKWDSIKEELSKLAQGLPEPVRNALGIQSPSKVFAALVGRPIVDGIVAGLNEQRPTLHRALGTLVPFPSPGGARPTVTTSAALGGVQGRSGAQAATITVNINLPNVTNIGDRGQVQDLAGALRGALNESIRSGQGGQIA